MNIRIRYLYRAWKYRIRQDRTEIAALLDRLHPGDLALDIGTHKGAYTYWMAKATGPGGCVVCFEPQAGLADYVIRAAAASRLRNVTVENLALSDSEGPGSIILPLEAKGGPSPGARLGSPGEAGTAVNCRTLDEYLAGHPKRPVRFIKCDVEGHELEVFRGGKRILTEDKPVILFECEERHRHGPIQEVFDFLHSLGYSGYYIPHKGGLREIRQFDPVLHQASGPGSKNYVNNFLFEVETLGDAALAT